MERVRAKRETFEFHEKVFMNSDLQGEGEEAE